MFIIDNDVAFNDFDSMIKSGEATLLSMNDNVANIIVNKKNIDVELDIKYLNQFNNIDKIIYGKNQTKNIVNISVKDNVVYLFKNDGSYETLPYKHWVLSHKPHPDFVPLKGPQHFKYIKEYPNIESFNRVKFNVYKLGMYTLTNYAEAFMIKNGYTYFKGMKPNEVSALSFDIETTGLDPDADDAQVLLITNTFRHLGILEKKTFCIEDYESDCDMINDWCMWVISKDPAIILGHNIVIFDLPYINRIMEKAGQHLILGRHDTPTGFNERTKELRVDGTQSYTYKPINIFGREVIDTFFLAIKADIAKKYVSYGLKNIIKQEGLEKAERQHYDASQIKKNWYLPEERTKIIRYAEEDSDDSLKLFDLMIAPFFYLTPHIPKPFQLMIESATGAQINSLMVRSYLQDGFSVAKAEEVEPFEGAISKAIPGVYSNCIRWDIAALYPSIMLTYKIGPGEKDFNGNFLKALNYFTLARLKNKKLAKETGDNYFKGLEQGQKIFCNSTYGFLGASGLNYNYGKGADAITRYGREILSKGIMWASGKTPEEIFINE